MTSAPTKLIAILLCKEMSNSTFSSYLPCMKFLIFASSARQSIGRSEDSIQQVAFLCLLAALLFLSLFMSLQRRM